ncbi:substrate-binding domain-containing protein [Eubacteriales bacterium OttesenSCG-928-A19]|nr:substrate-binding domain-containing protein [Eubacteriales bacterium OttesenSCG-928-A19]
MRRRMAALCALLLCMAMATPGAAEGSWGQINQELARPEGWQRIVTDSAFALGERTEIGTLDGRPLYEQAFGTYPSLDGSTVAVPMAMEFARQHLGLSDEDLAGFVFFSTTHGAYEHLIGKRPNGSAMITSENVAMDERQPVDLILATEPSDDELALAEANGVTLVMKPICYDAFVFITHADNPVQSLTTQQIQAIYTGDIVNWQEVGGENAAIHPYQREANSGSQTAMEKLVMQGRPLSAAEENYVTDGMGGLIRRVGSYENSAHSLGYTYQYYIDTLYRSDDIKVLAVDGIAPTAENLRSGAYPFTTNYHAVLRSDDVSAVAGQFLDWMLSPEGQRCIEQAGYIPVLDLSGVQ